MAYIRGGQRVHHEEPPQKYDIIEKAAQQMHAVTTTATVAYRPNDITHSLTVFIGLNFFLTLLLDSVGHPAVFVFHNPFQVWLVLSCVYSKELLHVVSVRTDFTCFSASNVPCQMIWCQCNCLWVHRKFEKNWVCFSDWCFNVTLCLWWSSVPLGNSWPTFSQ